MGKPTMAFVFLKYGLNKDKLELYAPKELKTAEAFIDFGQVSSAKNTIFASNYGMRARGCGGVDLNNSFRIPADITDSIAWVEDQLVTELALETAFEGNRFNDLMRISEHRADPTYLAAKVSAKFSDTRKNVIFNRLSTKSKWYLPSEE